MIEFDWTQKKEENATIFVGKIKCLSSKEPIADNMPGNYDNPSSSANPSGGDQPLRDYVKAAQVPYGFESLEEYRDSNHNKEINILFSVFFKGAVEMVCAKGVDDLGEAEEQVKDIVTNMMVFYADQETALKDQLAIQRVNWDKVTDEE